MFGNFSHCLAFVLVWEGGNDDDPDDPGGRTSRGIEQSEYDAWCHLHGAPKGDVWHAPDGTIAEIYQQQYWLPYCDMLPAGLDLMYFDTAVNEGPGKAVSFLQLALKGLDVDGHFGLRTAAAVKSITDVRGVITTMSVRRAAHYESLAMYNRKMVKFFKGWMSRNRACLKRALEMVAP
jgi:lysozyme family protein